MDSRFYNRTFRMAMSGFMKTGQRLRTILASGEFQGRAATSGISQYHVQYVYIVLNERKHPRQCATSILPRRVVMVIPLDFVLPIERNPNIPSLPT